MCRTSGLLCLAWSMALPVCAQMRWPHYRFGGGCFRRRRAGRQVDCSWRAAKAAAHHQNIDRRPLSFHRRPAGEFDLTVEAQGFVKATMRDVRWIPRARPRCRRSSWQLASVTQSVEVTAEAAGRGDQPTRRSRRPSAWRRSATCRFSTATRWPLMQIAAGRGLQRQFQHRDQRPAHLVFRHDPGRHQHPGQLHSRQRAGLLA